MNTLCFEIFPNSICWMLNLQTHLPHDLHNITRLVDMKTSPLSVKWSIAKVAKSNFLLVTQTYSGHLSITWFKYSNCTQMWESMKVFHFSRPLNVQQLWLQKISITCTLPSYHERKGQRRFLNYLLYCNL